MHNAYGTSQVEGGVPGMGVLIDNRPRRARAGAARKRAAPSPWLSAGGKQHAGTPLHVRLSFPWPFRALPKGGPPLFISSFLFFLLPLFFLFL